MSHIVNHFILLIPCIVDKQFATFNQQNIQYFYLDIYITISHYLFIDVSIHKGSSSGNQTKAILHKTKLVTFIHS
jgi:hypothetical protein